MAPFNHLQHPEPVHCGPADLPDHLLVHALAEVIDHHLQVCYGARLAPENVSHGMLPEEKVQRIAVWGAGGPHVIQLR